MTARHGTPGHTGSEGPRPPDLPAGWQIGPPDFVGVGTSRSGTTWWDDLIHRHPDVVRAPGVPKEIGWFDRYWSGGFDARAIEGYHRLFPRPSGSRAGEWTPEYVVNHHALRLLRRAAPDARLLVLLRDPVERFRSGRTLAENRLRVRGTPEAAATGAFARGLYADQLLGLWRVFPREHVLVLQYERCVRDTAGELRRTFAFLGLDPAATDAISTARVVNASKGAKIDLSSWQRSLLSRAYAPENARLPALVPDLDLGLWSAAP